MIRYVPCLILALIGMLLLAVGPSHAQVQHSLTIILEPQGHFLQGRDLIHFKPPLPEMIEFELASHARLGAVTVDGRPAEYRFEGGRLMIDGSALAADSAVVVEYGAAFDDPAPDKPLNTDNPGYGVTGAIDERGTLLLSGAGWYPASDQDSAMELVVDAPRGILAVTSGDLVGHADQGDRTLSRWKISGPFSRMSLAAGRFIHRTQPVGDGLWAATYFSQPLEHLSSSYLDAAVGYLQLYNNLFGPYAFNQFAVVENFFPTGYGFAGFTLLGRSVLKLPFIIHTSLGHEIAHSWWGNGVLVDFAEGNWCEGLTTYVADYLYQERRSAQAARQYRLQWLRNYASLVDPEKDFALSRFISRTDPVTKTIGYDKAAMVFHMLRQTVGDTVFWQTLRTVYAERRLKPTSWSDLQRAFEKTADRPLGTFFDQWVFRPGAPMLQLAQVQTRIGSQGQEVFGQLAQQQPHYALQVDLQLTTEKQTVDQQLPLDAARADFAFSTTGSPRMLVADPHVHIFRRLEPQEIPATINSVKGAGDLTICVNPNLDTAWVEAARRLRRSLGVPNARIVQGAPGPSAASEALIQIGPCDGGSLRGPVPAVLQTDDERFTFEGKVYDRAQGDSFFGVFRQNGSVTALFLPAADRQAAEQAVLKVTHYGKYSYLIFGGTENRVKGVWPAAQSPLIHDLHLTNQGANQRQGLE
jgi:hypothetical protein